MSTKKTEPPIKICLRCKTRPRLEERSLMCTNCQTSESVPIKRILSAKINASITTPDTYTLKASPETDKVLLME